MSQEQKELAPPVEPCDCDGCREAYLGPAQRRVPAPPPPDVVCDACGLELEPLDWMGLRWCSRCWPRGWRRWLGRLFVVVVRIGNTWVRARR